MAMPAPPVTKASPALVVVSPMALAGEPRQLVGAAEAGAGIDAET
jgi:hypothetical protein